ncbi:tautomerase family protein [Roseomonas sp. GCM10028921]
MPHVIIKLAAGRTDQRKARIAEEVMTAIMASTGNGEAVVSVSIEDIQPADWAEAVYRPEIFGKPDTLYKKPGYGPL